MKEKEIKQRLEKTRELLAKSNGNITEETIRDLKEITTSAKTEQTKSALTNIKNGIDSNSIASKISEIPNSDVVERAIEKTLNSLLNPVKLSFAREISRYVDAISADKKTTKKIPRTVTKSSIKKFVDGKFVPAAEGEEGKEKVINPDFKQLLSSGYKPKDVKEYEQKRDELFPFFKEAKDNKQAPPSDSNPFTNIAISLADPEIGDPNSDFIKNFVGGEQPGEKTENIPIVQQKYASIFIDSFDIKQESIKYEQKNDYSEIGLKGSFKGKNEVPGIPSEPNWDINYKEQGEKFFLTIKNNFKYSKNSGLLPNIDTYRLVGNIDKGSLSNAALNKIDQINKGDKCNVNLNNELFPFILLNRLNGLIDERSLANLTTQERDEFSSYLKDTHSSLIKAFIQDLFDEVTNNRLLQDFKMTNPIAGMDQKSNLILLNLVNFIPETNEELRSCGKTIHPLNTDEVVRIMKAKFNSIGLQTFPSEKCSPSEEPKNALTEASLLGSSLLLIRLCIFEYILKNLFVFDELMYSDTFIQSSLIKEYVSLIVKKELDDIGLYDEVEEIIENSYDLLKEQQVIKEEDEIKNTDIFSNLVNDVNYQHASDKIKIVINSLFRKTMNYVKKLLGSTSQKTITELDILSNNIYDLNNKNNICNQNSKIDFEIEELLKNKISNISRIEQDKKGLKSFFILEKFVASNENLSFQEYAENISNLLSEQHNVDPAKKIKISLRMSLVLKSNKIHKISKNLNLNNPSIKNQSNTSLNQFLTDTKNLFFYNNTKTVKIKPNIISLKKNYVFYDYDENYSKDQTCLSHYNSLPVQEAAIEITNQEILKYGTNKENILKALNEIFSNRKQEILNILQQDAEYQILIRKTMMSDKIMNLLSFYSHSALSTEDMEGLFKKSKNKLKELINAAKNIDNYAYQNDTDLKGGDAAQYQNDFQNTGNPNGSGGVDLLQFLITTPILILKGITQMMDPNIAIASQIVNAASAGLLFPKTNEQGELQYPGDPLILPTALASMALLPINLLPPGFGIGPPVTPIPGMLYWALEPLLWKLPFFQNQAAKSSDAKNLKNDPKYKGFSVGNENFNCNKDQDDI